MRGRRAAVAACRACAGRQSAIPSGFLLTVGASREYRDLRPIVDVSFVSRQAPCACRQASVGLLSAGCRKSYTHDAYVCTITFGGDEREQLGRR